MPKKDLHILGLKDIVIIEGFNVRYDYGDIKSLADSIKENGIKIPLRGFKKNGVYHLVDGHRRYKAVKLLSKLGVDVDIPLVSETKGTSQEQRVIDLILTNEGKQLNPLEQSEAINRLVEFGYNNTQIAKKTGFSSAYIGNLRVLHGATDEIKTMIKEGNISSTYVIKLLKEHENQQEVASMVKEAVDDVSKQTEQDDVPKKQDNTKSTPESKQASVTPKTFSSKNSLSELKKAMRIADKEELPVRPEHANLHEFAEQLTSNKLGMQEIVELLFELPDNSDGL